MGEYKTNSENLLYSYPEYYDILLNRDVSSETAFLAAIFEQYCGYPLQSYWGLLFGPGYHAGDMSNRVSLTEKCSRVIGKKHPQDTPMMGYGPFHDRKSRDGKEVVLDWATDVITDTRSQTAEVLLKLHITENGHTQTICHRTREFFPTPIFLEATARLSGALEPTAWYGDFDLKRPYDDSPCSKHCISIYRRPPGLEIADGDT